MVLQALLAELCGKAQGHNREPHLPSTGGGLPPLARSQGRAKDEKNNKKRQKGNKGQPRRGTQQGAPLGHHTQSFPMRDQLEPMQAALAPTSFDSACPKMRAF